MTKKVDLPDSWLNLIIDELHKQYMDDNKKIIIENKKKGITCSGNNTVLRSGMIG